MTTNSQSQLTKPAVALHMAMELSSNTWKLAFADQLGRNPRVRTIDAGDFVAMCEEIDSSLKVFKLDEDTPVISCYEAGRDGFWIHRSLVALDIENHIVEPASIQVTRKKRRVKTDRIDAQKIVAALIRFKLGDRHACRMIRVPDMESEDTRHLNREMRTIKAERTAHNNRIKGLLVTQGVTTVAIDRHFVERLDLYRTPAGKPLGTRLKERLTREFERMALATEQIRSLQMQQAAMIRHANKEPEGCSPAAMIAGRLCSLSGIGPVTSWTLSTEIFSWRDISNRRQLAALVGLVPTPHTSGDDEREQGISKSGRAELRDLMIEIAWGWLRFQPDSELTKWYQRRFDDGTKRNRKIGIVAVARKLLVALGKYVRDGEIPAGAKMDSTRKFHYMTSLMPKDKTPTVAA